MLQFDARCKPRFSDAVMQQQDVDELYDRLDVDVNDDAVLELQHVQVLCARGGDPAAAAAAAVAAAADAVASAASDVENSYSGTSLQSRPS